MCRLVVKEKTIVGLRCANPTCAGQAHPITHISPLPELPRIAGAFYKDGDLLETQPDGFGAWLAFVPEGAAYEEAGLPHQGMTRGG